MCRSDARQAFWSIDAAFALVLAVAMFALFSMLLYAAGITATQGAGTISGEFLSSRFSSYALSQIDSLEQVDLQLVLEGTGREYASLRVGDEFAYAGKESGVVYCTQRLAVKEGKIVKLEACIG